MDSGNGARCALYSEVAAGRTPRRRGFRPGWSGRARAAKWPSRDPDGRGRQSILLPPRLESKYILFLNLYLALAPTKTIGSWSSAAWG